MSIGIVGMGYVGLPLAVGFAEAGVRRHRRRRRPGQGRRPARRATRTSRTSRPSASARCSSAAAFTTRFVELHEAEAILVCVPTPLTRNREPDLGPLLSASRALAGVIAKGQLVVLESTTFPGTTREHLVPLLEESGLRAGEDFNLAFSPERVDPGRTDYTLRNTPKVVGGLTPALHGARGRALRARLRHVVPVSTPEVAELSKLLENIFRSVNIALVNEMAMLADRMEIDIWEVIDAAATKPFGFTRFDPGPGMGGHCLPVDPFYLTWKAREYDMSTEFIELAGKVNQHMPYFCLEKIERALNDAGKAVRGAKVLVVGVAYKGGTSDTRESPALKIVDLLVERGADVSYHDPFVPEIAGTGCAAWRSRTGLEAHRPGRHRHGASGRRPRGDRAPRAADGRSPRRDADAWAGADPPALAVRPVGRRDRSRARPRRFASSARAGARRGRRRAPAGPCRGAPRSARAAAGGGSWSAPARMRARDVASARPSDGPARSSSSARCTYGRRRPGRRGDGVLGVGQRRLEVAGADLLLARSDLGGRDQAGQLREAGDQRDQRERRADAPVERGRPHARRPTRSRSTRRRGRTC